MAYRTVNERFWRDPKVLKLSSKDKLLFLYLITSADAHYSGIYYCPLQIIQLETGLSEKDVLKGIDTLSKGYMVEYDKGSNEVFVINMAKFQVVSKQQVKGGTNALDNLQFLSWFENRCKNDMSQEEWDNLKSNIEEYFI